MRRPDLLTSAHSAFTDTAALDAAITSANAEGAELMAEVMRLQTEMMRCQDLITAHNARQGTPRAVAERDRLKTERDELERRAQDMIAGAIQPLTQRLKVLTRLRRQRG